MATPFAFMSEQILVNKLGPLELQFKSLVTTNLIAPDSYAWDFGDGTQVIDGREVIHTYATPGTFIVAMNVETTGGPVADQVEVTLDGTFLLLAAEEEEDTKAAA
jgi:hypothetical protein